MWWSHPVLLSHSGHYVWPSNSTGVYNEKQSHTSTTSATKQPLKVRDPNHSESSGGICCLAKARQWPQQAKHAKGKEGSYSPRPSIDTLAAFVGRRGARAAMRSDLVSCCTEYRSTSSKAKRPALSLYQGPSIQNTQQPVTEGVPNVCMQMKDGRSGSVGCWCVRPT